VVERSVARSSDGGMSNRQARLSESSRPPEASDVSEAPAAAQDFSAIVSFRRSPIVRGQFTGQVPW
jgi:hypothetical protein